MTVEAPPPTNPTANRELHEALAKEFSDAFCVFIPLLVLACKNTIDRESRFFRADYFDAMLSNLDDARDDLCAEQMRGWLSEVLAIHLDSAGRGALMDVKYILSELHNFNAAVAMPLHAAPETLSTSPSVVDRAPQSDQKEVATQAKNIKDSIEMLVKDALKIPWVRKLLRVSQGKKDQKNAKRFGAATRYLNEMLKFSGAS